MYKELAPWDLLLAMSMEERGLEAVRLPTTRNSSTEVYLTNMVAGMSWSELQKCPQLLLERMGEPKLIPTYHEMEVTLPEKPLFSQLPPNQKCRNPLPIPDYTLTMDKLREKYKLLPTVNTSNSMRELALVHDVGDSMSGIVKNGIMWRLLKGLNTLRGFADTWSLTDTSARGTIEVFQNNVDTVNLGETKYDALDMEVLDMLVLK